MNPRAAWILIVAVALVALLMTMGWPRRPPIRSRFGAGSSAALSVALSSPSRIAPLIRPVRALRAP
jgi:hypothetical protein